MNDDDDVEALARAIDAGHAANPTRRKRGVSIEWAQRIELELGAMRDDVRRLLVHFGLADGQTADGVTIDHRGVFSPGSGWLELVLVDEEGVEMSKEPKAKCSSCGGTCLWVDDSWVCKRCGDEWSPEHGPEYAIPGTPPEPQIVLGTGLPDRIAIDANGFGWRVWDDSDGFDSIPAGGYADGAIDEDELERRRAEHHRPVSDEARVAAHLEAARAAIRPPVDNELDDAHELAKDHELTRPSPVAGVPPVDDGGPGSAHRIAGPGPTGGAA